MLEVRKARLRQDLRAALGAVTDRADRSARVVSRLLAWERFRSAGVVMLFVPVGGEVDVLAAGEAVLQRGGRVCLPRVDWAAGKMSAREVSSLTDGLVVGRAGLREPGPETSELSAAELGLILVPGLGFDDRGGRIGRGAGFYDRYLAPVSDGSGRARLACGVGFEAQVAEEIPMGPMDIRLGAVVTEARLIEAVPA